MALDLSPYALVTVARLKTHLGRTSIGESDVADRCTAAINAATAWLERRTARALKARNYRTEFLTRFDTTSGDATMDASDYTLLKRGDDVRMSPGETPCIATGTQIASIGAAPTYEIEATIAATGTVTQAYVVIGSEPLVCDGTGESVLDMPQWPLQELWAAYSVDYAGTRTALSISSARLHKASGTIELPYDVFPAGERNIELECRAGYEQPTTEVRGNVDDWNALEALALRVAEVFYSDGLNLRGRQTDISMGGLSASVGSYEMPADIMNDSRRFVRTR
jgi:hypothetical protein